MKLNLKRVLMTLALLGILLALSLGAFSAAASSDDPAEGYVPTAAANEDAGLKLWFEHSFKKVLTKDTTPSDMDTYSVYMAKNEIENCQFVLYSDTTKAGMSATVTSFTDKDGNEIIHTFISDENGHTVPEGCDQCGLRAVEKRGEFVIDRPDDLRDPLRVLPETR